MLSTALLINHLFSSRHFVPFYNGCLKVWSHAGYQGEHEANSLESYQHAFDLGAKGVELDIFYDPKGEQFIVSHDLQYEPDGGETLYLSEVFEKLGEKGYFWLDLKNLGRLNRSEAVKAADILRSDLDKFDLGNKIIVESKVAKSLVLFANRNIFTSLWITPGRNDSWFDSRIKNLLYKSRFLKGRFSAFSMNYLNYTPYVQNSLGSIPVHLFTINDLDEIREYMPITNVKIILSDENFFSLDSCDE
ncbi:MAG: hypothetical protein RQ767_04810 [Thermovirgaceae bacterium]|nr:hypothetical protein [Thermovirgaceae bacterium]